MFINEEDEIKLWSSSSGDITDKYNILQLL